MKKYIKVILFYCFCLVSCGQNKTENQNTNPIHQEEMKDQTTNQFNPEKYYTTKDSVLLASFEEDIVYVLKDDFNDVVRNHPEFFVEFPNDPYVTYSSIPSSVEFGSEVGQDMYYLYYAYFLKNTNEMYKIDDDFNDQRKKIMIIYTRLNRMFSLLDGGGPGYMHLYRRTFGEAEYAIYLYALTRKDFTVKYDITKQKDLFKQTLQQIVTDRLENTFDIHETEKPELKKELFALINEIDAQITDAFYLTQAQQFYYGNYATW
ncbi:hypothetical protein SAMN05421741_109121 [Paenimyroides ummariense]|uniref:Uncharacterized protein n=1 Tax=Paenimyroides ummariense TaxID=913024 RepID=A0A1I5B9Z1_9FLAO|nr:hypothetical protein [Paenimyroides ummariense]SFN71507.1 hypothetical protein SAMN05421741_109121 [Paenimyroides ummariense]